MKRRVPMPATDEEGEVEASGRFRRSRSFKRSAAALNPTRQKAVQQLRRMVLDAIGARDAAAYLFGSTATGNVRHASDIDVAILPREELPPSFFAELAERIEESTIPYHVDLIDLRKVPKKLQEEVTRSGTVWRD